jgi:LPXTG-site transpeptidase (sortase) family protein
VTTHRRKTHHRGLAAAVVAVFCGLTGVTSLALAMPDGTAPPQPTVLQQGTIPPPFELQARALSPAGSSALARPRGGTSSGGTSTSVETLEAPTPDATTPDATTPDATMAAGNQSSTTRLMDPGGQVNGEAVLDRSLPVRLDIPEVSIHTNLLRLGLNPDDTLEVPWKPLLAGWFTSSPTPGELGPSIIAGHVDSAETGPAVFYRLGELAPGDRVYVTRSDGTVATFAVNAVRAYAKDDFPTETVYGNTNRADLRLITCGDWNSEIQEYVGNTVIFASLVGVRNA